MLRIDSKQTSDSYTQACTIQNVWQSSGGFASVSDADVYMQLQYSERSSAVSWTDEIHISKGTPITFTKGVEGVRFRSYQTGVAATISAALSFPDEPAIQISTAQTSVSLAGSVNVQHNDILIGTEPTLDFEDGIITWNVHDDTANTRIQISGAGIIHIQQNDVAKWIEPYLDFEDTTTPLGITWTLTDDAAHTRTKIAAAAASTLIAHDTGTRNNITTTGTTFAAGTDILSGPISFTADGVHDYLFTVNAAEWDNSGAAASSNVIRLNLDSADAGFMAVSTVQTIGDSAEILSASTPIIAPSAGAHTVNARFTVSAGTGTIKAGVGGAGAYRPVFGALYVLE